MVSKLLRGHMKNKFQLLFILITVIIVSFPSICFSEMKTVTGEYCDVYMGDMKNKKELDEFRQTVKTNSIENGLYKHTKHLKHFIHQKCFNYVISNYIEKVVVVSHSEKSRKICDKVKITIDTEVVDKYLDQKICILQKPFDDLPTEYEYDIDNILTKINEKINIGLVVETKIPDIEENKKELLENEEEKLFFDMVEKNKDKYKVVDRRHLKTILEEQKLSSSGLTESETVKLGKLLNLDVIVLRLIYENSNVTKVLRVDTGEVLLFKTYETKNTGNKTEEGWVHYGTSKFGDYYYDKSSILVVSPNVFRVWEKVIFFESVIKSRKKIDNTTIDNHIQLVEWDCVNNTEKKIKYVKNDDEGNILGNYDYPNPSTDQVSPDTISWVLLRKVCPNK